MGILSRKVRPSQALPPAGEDAAARSPAPPGALPDPARRGLPRLLLGLALAAAAGCGRKGDLYLPAPGDGDDPAGPGVERDPDAPAEGPAPAGSPRE